MYVRRAAFGLPGFLVLIGISALALADREPVLKQIDVPHDYYFR
jgi:hypothetical protein